jgi:hypothetical protein
VNVACIGLGTIAEKYLDVMYQMDQIKIQFICDLFDTPLKMKYEDKLDFIKDYQMIPTENLDAVFVLTPPNTHYEIAKYFLNQNVHVYLEKPATTNLKDLRNLNKIAKQNQVTLNCIFHWQYGNEVLFLKKNKSLFEGFEDLYISVYDPYYKGSILDHKIHLGGAWLDSGINALSFLSLFLNINELKLMDSILKIDEKSDLDYAQTRIYDYHQKRVTIEVIWNDTINNKTTTIYKNNQKIEILHSLQAVSVDDEIIYQENSQDRLFTHYQNFFKTIVRKKIKRNQIYKIHKKTFEKTIGGYHGKTVRND